MAEAQYDPRYLRGIEQFNERNFFESHEIWESLWLAERGHSRQFYKGLIHAAVALHHLGRGNAHGARKLWASSRRYLEPYRSRHLGLDVDAFLAALSGCLAEALERPEQTAPIRPSPSLVPKITLAPAPTPPGS